MPSTPVPFPASPLAEAARNAHGAAHGAARAVSPEHARLVGQSWAIAMVRADLFASTFYAHLLAVDPSLRLLFLGETSEQARERGRRLLHALDVAVANLHRFDARAAEVWGARPWDSVGAALFGALDQVLGVAFTPPLRDAWLAAYGAIAGAMKAAGGTTASGMAA